MSFLILVLGNKPALNLALDKPRTLGTNAKKVPYFEKSFTNCFIWNDGGNTLFEVGLVWFGLVDSISTFVGYLIPKTFL